VTSGVGVVVVWRGRLLPLRSSSLFRRLGSAWPRHCCASCRPPWTRSSSSFVFFLLQWCGWSRLESICFVSYRICFCFHYGSSSLCYLQDMSTTLLLLSPRHDSLYTQVKQTNIQIYSEHKQNLTINF
jgi:hypothetical protein